ncbi:hypothetical protein ACQU0X_27340 [Pseudovibrio ascidiaceicola]|uniref:hypothetical protein n=1 Tax=Pseudovibrio ascidiaceicola TaxID=285279 RepID=UPI003D360C00
MGGLTYDGRYISSESLGGEFDDFSGMVHIDENSPSYLLEAADAQPLPILDQISDFIGEADKQAFANYGKDWWLGVLYKPARNGLLGPTAQQNATEAGDFIALILKEALKNYATVYKVVKLGLTFALGNDEFESKIAECITKHPKIEERIDSLQSTIGEKASKVPFKAAKRYAGGVFVAYTTRGGKYGKKYLSGRLIKSDYTKLTRVQSGFNVWAASWGSWLRCYIELAHNIRIHRTSVAVSKSIQRPDILMLMGTMLTGDSSAFALDSDDFLDLVRTAEKCGVINEEDMEAFKAILQMGIAYYEEAS